LVILRSPCQDKEFGDYISDFENILEEAEKLHKLSDGLLNIAQARIDIKIFETGVTIRIR